MVIKRKKRLTYNRDPKTSLVRENEKDLITNHTYCFVCGTIISSGGGNLIMHHVRYKNNYSNLNIIIAVCRDCHNLIHESNDYPDLKPIYDTLIPPIKKVKTKRSN